MGKGCGTMDEKHSKDTKGNTKPLQLRQEAQLRAHSQNMSRANEAREDANHENNLESVPCPTVSESNDATSRLVASTSSPSLLDGCSDSSTHAGANVERHMHSHNVHVNIIPHSPVTPGVQVDSGMPTFQENPPDSLFLTSSPPRSRQNSGRPSSAPADQLERISGTLLRLVGDHFLCSNCGRQLRNIGDQMALEANIKRTLSAGNINSLRNDE